MKEMIKPLLITAAVVVVVYFVINNFLPASLADRLNGIKPAAK